ALARAEQDLSIGETELDETIPAQISAANASVELAKVEYERAKTLRARNAGSQSELDNAKATFENALAEVKQIVAAEKTQVAQIESLKSAVRQAQQDVRDAKRDLEDCTLYSSFDGKVAESFVVPGSMVSAAKPVVKIQMMDPIKIELEVSAKQSRQLRRTEKIPVHVSMPDGSIEVCDGFLHQIDPSADPQTRTFTLTVLLMNQQLARADDLPPTSTRDIWRLDLGFIPGAVPGQLFVEEGAILIDSEGHYLWQITNATIQTRSRPDQVFEVRKLRVTLGEAKIPYLGELVFQQVQVEDEQFDPAVNLVVGKLKTPGTEPNEWNGDKVWLDSPNRWLLRPGDLVEIDLSGGGSSPGYFVPMDAICRKAGQSFLYVVESADSETIVRRFSIDVLSEESNTSSMRRIKPLDDMSLEGMRYVTKGAHFLTDGEQVNVTAAKEGTR
ncbi:MAG: HlyD family efflux transporter periplasmic adaptor subunit, partial [Planctomycetota bacterium]